MRSTTKRRLSLLFFFFVVVVAIGGGVTYFSLAHSAHKLKQERADGMTAYDAGRYDVSLDKLSDYVGQYQDDADALYALAVSRSNVAMPNGRHMTTAITYLNKYLDLRRGDSKGQHELLSLYMRVRWNPETLSLSDEILAVTPTDQPALKAKMNALVGQHNYEAAVAVSEKINELNPLDMEAQRMTYTLLAQLKHPAADLVARAKADADKHPNDPRFELLEASAYGYAGDQTTAQSLLNTAMSRPAPDAEYVRMVVKLLDDNQEFDQSQQFLTKSADQLKDPAVLKMLVERLWQNGQIDEMNKAVAAVNANDPNADTNLLAMKAISLLQSDKPGDATNVVKILASRTSDDEAFGWSAAIAARYGSPAPAPKIAVQQLLNAANRDHDNSVIRLWLGDAYKMLGENEQAVNAWRASASLAPAWAEPLIRQAKLLADNGRGHEAYTAAFAALHRTPKALQARVAGALAYASLPSFDPEAISGKQMLDMVQAIQSESPSEPQTLPLYVSLLTQSGQKDAALAAISKALTQSPLASGDDLLKVAAISRDLKLDQQGVIEDAVANAGNHTFQLALARATDTLAASNVDAALQGITAAATAGNDAAGFAIASASLLDLAKDARAAAAWKDAVTKYLEDLRVQRAYLASPAHVTDRDTWAAAVEHLKAGTMDDAYSWRLERARYLMAGTPSDKDRAEASGLLNDLTRAYPNPVDPRLLLANVLMGSNNLDGAIEQYKAALLSRPNDPQLTLDLARLLNQDGKGPEAQAYLQQLSGDGRLTGAGARVVAQMLADQGQVSDAITLLQQSPADPSRDAMLGHLLLQSGRAPEAKLVFARLASAKPITVEALAAVADYDFATDRPADAKAALDRMSDATDASPGQAEMVKARLAEQYDTTDSARASYTAAAKAVNSAAAWRELAGFELRQGKFDAAKAAVAQGLAVANSDANLTATAKLIDIAATLPPSVNAADEVAILSHDPTNAPASDLLNAALASASAHESADAIAARLKPIAAKYPKSLLAVRRLVDANLSAGQIDAARQAATGAAAAFPNESAPLQMLYDVYTASNDFSAAQATAQQWRNTAIANPQPADIAIASADIGLTQYQAALYALQPYLAAAKKDVPHSMDVLSPYCRALLRLNRTDDAKAILADAAKSDALVRRLWLTLAPEAGPNAVAAMAWVDQVSPMLDSANVDDQVELARAVFLVAQRYSDTTTFARAVPLLKAVATQTNDPSLYAMEGEALRQGGDLAGAEAALRAAIAHGDTGYSPNALAYLLLTEKKSLDEAMKLASGAIAASPKTAGFYDTRGQIYLQAGQTDNAMHDFDQALALQPDLIDSLVGKADALAKAGRKDQAADLLKHIDAINGSSQDLSDYTRGQLAKLKSASIQ